MRPRVTFLLPLLFTIAGCGTEPVDQPPAGGTTPAQSSTATGSAEREHGARAALGQQTAFGRTFQIVQYGDVAPGEEAAFELEFASGQERITTARGWIGVASGKGSMKSLWELEGDANMHGHVEVPAALPEGGKLWIDLELDGETETVSVAYR